MEEYLKKEIERLHREVAWYEKIAETARTIEFKHYNLGLAQGFRRMAIKMFEDLQRISN